MLVETFGFQAILSTIGFAMIFVIIYALMSSKATPAPIFVIVSLIAAAVAGFSPNEMGKFIQSGVGTTTGVAVLFIFSIVYFGIMLDVGLFEPLVNFLVRKAGSNVVAITVATSLIATIAHLDGALASTLLITVPAMLPIYKKLNIRPVILLVIIGSAMSIMNLVPWGGPVARIGAITKTDPGLLWQHLIPLQGVILIVNLFFAAALGMWEKKRGAGSIEAMAEIAKSAVVDPKIEALKRPKLLWVNGLLTLGVIALLVQSEIKMPTYAPFMIGLALALVINFDPKTQAARIKAHAGEALSMAAILLSSGIFLGVLTGTKMLGAMATTLINIVPDFMGPYLHLVLGFFSVPIGMALGTDSYFFGLTPLAIGVGAKYGIDALNMSYAMLIGKNYGVLVTPHAATTYLAVGLAGIEIKELFKVGFPLLWALGTVSLIMAVIMGIVLI